MQKKRPEVESVVSSVSWPGWHAAKGSREPSLAGRGGGLSPSKQHPARPVQLSFGSSRRRRLSPPPHPGSFLAPPLPPNSALSAPAHKSFMSRLRGPPGWLPERRPRSPARLPDRPWDRAGLERRRPWRRAGEARGGGCRGTCCRPPSLAPWRSRAGT